jgi:hypothetical protein
MGKISKKEPSDYNEDRSEPLQGRNSEMKDAHLKALKITMALKCRCKCMQLVEGVMSQA